MKLKRWIATSLLTAGTVAVALGSSSMAGEAPGPAGLTQMANERHRGQSESGVVPPSRGLASEKTQISFPMDHRSWEHINSVVIHDKQNPLFGFLSIYGNSKAAEAAQAGGTYADGSSFVGIFHDVVDNGGIMSQGKRMKYVVMTRDARQKDTGGWTFEAFDPDGKTQLVKDPKAECFQCHTQVANQQFVFSKFNK
ncbi:MAG: cytochrome P460 family protein [Nitrospinae bacterium]|nr:cytochrome P460 family protein [Nitrospinota bacterium]